MQRRTVSAFAAIALGLAPVGCGPAEKVDAPEPVMIDTEVTVTGGAVRGIVNQDGLKEYHGIPYAAPPIGERRWAPPEAIESWTGVRDATSPGPGCVQQGAQGGFYDSATAVAAMDEDGRVRTNPARLYLSWCGFTAVALRSARGMPTPANCSLRRVSCL
ncbi:MAG: carboxylesterase family protein [Pseudomonadales bacterium]|nr:carboxylesterase family protein [Pseudomonadales bacterium]